MYVKKDRQTGNLFQELFPYGGKLDEKNQWIRLGKLIPWDVMDEVYASYFSEGRGRPGKESRLITGLLVVKHRKGYSDRGVIEELVENPYVQYFCGYEHFVTGEEVHYSTLSKSRKRLGKKYFERFESEVLEVVKKGKRIRPRALLTDATVCPAEITYPTDSKLVNAVREWLCEQIARLRRIGKIKEKIRTYRRKGRQVYLRFQKKRRKRRKEIRVVQKKLLRYVRRNIVQLEKLLGEMGERLRGKLRRELEKRLEIARMIYAQQWEMIKEKRQRIRDRIVSFHWPEVRPIVRGKEGKEVEFGPKVMISEVDGYAFLDVLSFDAYNEAKRLLSVLKAYRARFGRLPERLVGDRIFGTRWNRTLLKRIKVGEAFQPLGKGKLSKERMKVVKRWNRRRNRVEGKIGVGKRKYLLDRVRYRIPDGANIWIRLGLLGMNLTTALERG